MELDTKTVNLLRSLFAKDEDGNVYLRLSPCEPKGEVVNAVDKHSSRGLGALLNSAVVLDKEGKPCLRIIGIDDASETLEQNEKRRREEAEKIEVKRQRLLAEKAEKGKKKSIAKEAKRVKDLKAKKKQVQAAKAKAKADEKLLAIQREEAKAKLLQDQANAARAKAKELKANKKD